MRDYQLYIGGQDRDGVGHLHAVPAQALLDDVLTAVSAKRELDRGRRELRPDDPVFARCAVADESLIEEALQAAAAAAPLWRRFSLDDRLDLMRRVYDELLARRSEAIEILMQEGHPRKLAELEVQTSLDIFHTDMLPHYRQQMEQEYLTPDRHLRLVRKPDGVVCLSPPQNAAAANSALGIGVLVGGNTLVMRAPQATPAGVFFLWRDIVVPILDEMGAPPGTVNIITGNTAKMLNAWVESPLVDDVFYFGDSESGIALGQRCMAAGKKPILELAGNDGVMVWRDADLDRAAQAVSESFLGSGQICLVPNFVVVHPDAADGLLAHLLRLVRDLRPGMPEEDDAVLSPVRQSDRFFAVLQEALDAGATLLSGGHRCELDGTASETGPFIAPTVVRVDSLEEARKLRAVTEETFFPLLPVVVPSRQDDASLLDAMVDFLNANDYGLRNSLWAEDPAVVERFCTDVTTGGLLKINDSHVAAAAPLPMHGGTGLSGGPFGEANNPMIKTTHLQGISIGIGVNPAEALFRARGRSLQES
jgi:acyl-CoA reductase-like NAD-dependent aldehyde dehydrogenase